MAVYLSSFYPLCSTKAGRQSIKNYKLPPFIDGSCRREPDFENKYPAITGLCRPGFAEKLKKADIVVYRTNKGGVGSRKVVAILKVKEIFKTHREAANWYIKRNRKIPNNLMVKETVPFDLDKTHQLFGWGKWASDAHSLAEWDNFYKERAKFKDNEKVAQCEVFYKELKTPVELTEKDWKGISKRALCTQNPPILTEREWLKLKSKMKFKEI